MTLETIFITQLASILSFIIMLFVLYRILVSTKDATIENLRQQISSTEQKIKELLDQDPDILLQRYQRKIDAYEKELREVESNTTQSTETKKIHEEKINKLESQLARYEMSFEKGFEITKTRKISALLRKKLIDLYDGRCQVCGLQNSTIIEVGHIQSFNSGGETSLENMLLLCPNDHRLLDRGQLGINEDYTLVGISAGKLNISPIHTLSQTSLKWHRDNVLIKKQNL